MTCKHKSTTLRGKLESMKLKGVNNANYFWRREIRGYLRSHFEEFTARHLKGEVEIIGDNTEYGTVLVSIDNEKNERKKITASYRNP